MSKKDRLKAQKEKQDRLRKEAELEEQRERRGRRGGRVCGSEKPEGNEKDDEKGETHKTKR